MLLPNHRGGEATGGMEPPEHRLKGPLVGASSSGGAVMPKPRLRGKGPPSSEKAAPSGIGSSGRSTKKAATAAAGSIGSSGGIALKNVSNFTGSPRSWRNELSNNSTPAATTHPRVARETKYTRPWTSSSPKGPSLRSGQQLISTKTCRRRFSLLSINDADSLTSTPADACSATSHLCNTAADGSGSHFSNTDSGICLGPMERPGTGLSGELMPLSAGFTVKADKALSLETPPDPSDAINLNAEAQQEHQSVTGSHVETPLKHQAVTYSSGGMPREHQVVLGLTGGTTAEHQTVTGSSGETTLGHEAVTGSNRETAQKHCIKVKAQREHQSVTGSHVETPRKHQAVMGSSGGMPREHQGVKGSTRGTAWRNKAVAGPNTATSRNHRIKEKADGVSSEQNMAQKCYRKEKTVPSRQVRHPSGTERAGTNKKIPTAREKRQSKNNPSFSRESTLHADHKLRRTSSAAHQSEELTDDEERRLTKEMMIKVQEADLLIQELNKMGVGENIDQDELQLYYEQLPSEPPRVDTSLELDDDQIKKLQVQHVLCRIKYYKVTQQWRQDDPYELEDGDHLCRLKEKLKCFVEDESKLDEDHILDHLDKEDLLAYIEKEDTLDWSFRYLMVASLDNYQRLVPQNCTGEYVHWDDYCNYFHKYEIELEYLDFWEELSKKLKWMEDYIHHGWPTLKWRRICNRGESQAIKIATGFSNITARLAVAAYYEFIDSMNMEICWYRELDGVYFEIWKRVTKLKMSFREALNEVYELNKFPLREHVMKCALESSGFLMEMEFHNCTKGITEEVTEDKAQDLIVDGIANLWTRPKFYAQYIRKKMEIASVIGIIPAVSP